MIILLCLVHGLNESRRSCRLQKLERKLSNAVSFDVLLYHPCKFDDFLSTFLLFVLNLSRKLQGFMLLAEDQILELLKVELLHVNSLFPCALWMVVFVAFWVFTFDCSSTLVLLTDKTLVFESLLFDIFDSFDADDTILFLEIAFRHPNCTDIMDPDIVTDWYISWICGFYEVIIVTFLLFFTFFPDYLDNIILILLLSFYILFWYIFFFLLAVWTLLRILIVCWVGLFEEIDIDVNGSSFHGPSFDVAKRARKIDSCWSKGQAKIAYPAVCRHFRETNTALMQTDVAHATKDNEIVLGVISISANLTLSIFILPLPFIFLKVDFTPRYFFAIFLLSIFLHILKILLFFWVKLEDKLKRIFGWNRHKVFFDFWELDWWKAWLKNANDFINRKLKNPIKKKILFGILLYDWLCIFLLYFG